MRTLQEEGFIDHKSYGPTYQDFAKVTREEYKQRSLVGLIDKYFDNSYINAVSALVKEETFHRLNRVVLVGVVVASFLLPLCVITIRKPMEMAPEVYVQRKDWEGQHIPFDKQEFTRGLSSEKITIGVFRLSKHCRRLGHVSFLRIPQILHFLRHF